MLVAAAQLAWADKFILICYFLANLGIGVYFFRRMRGMKDYFSGGERVPWWLSGVSFYMSCFSVFAFIAYSKLAYQHGWLPITLFWAYIPATLLSAYVFAPRWRRARIASPVEYLETRFTPAMRQLVALQGVPVKIIDDALKLLATGIFVAGVLDLPLKPCIFWSGVVVLGYTLLGGLWAVVVTDFLQFVVLIAGVLVLCPLAIGRAGGLSAWVHNTPPAFFRPVSAEFDWIYVGTMAFMFCLSFTSVHWQLIQRFTSVRDERATRRVGLCVSVLHLVTPIIMFLPAMAAAQFMPGMADAEKIYPAICTALLPSGLLGLIIAAMLAATMSMLSGDYNVCANVLTHDVYRRLVRPGASQRELVAVGRMLTLLVGSIALGIAFLVGWHTGWGGREDSLFRSMVQLFSVATAPVAVPMIAGLLFKRVTPRGALAGFLAGLAVGLGLFFGITGPVVIWDRAFKTENVILYATTVVTLIVTFAVSLCTRPSPEQAARIAAFMRRLETPIGALPEERASAGAQEGPRGISPFGISGVMVVIVAAMMLVILPSVWGTAAFKLNLGVALALAVLGAAMIAAGRRMREGELGKESARQRKVVRT